MTQKLSARAQKVQDLLHTLGYESRVVELLHSTRTAPEAAHAIGCQVGQIVKSLIFRGKQSNIPIFVVASGINRVNEQRLYELVGEPIEKADAQFVREHTGFAVGGVPPVGHAERLTTYIDEDLLQYEAIWAAAGTPHAVFQLTPSDLQAMTGGQVVALK